MVSVKLAAALLALVCLLQLQEGSAFFVKRDTDSATQELSWEKIQETLTKAFDDVKAKVTDPAFMEQARSKLEGFNKQLEEVGNKVKQELDKAAVQVKDAVGTGN